MDKEHEEAIIRMEPFKYSTNDIKDIGRKYFLLNKKELI
jgi:hypothetical protein